jgi:hypothetical protein
MLGWQTLRELQRILEQQQRLQMWQLDLRSVHWLLLHCRSFTVFDHLRGWQISQL